MDEGKFAADFIAKNFSNIMDFCKSAYGKVDETLQVKLKTAYVNYLDNTHEKYSKGKSFFVRNESIDLYDYYVPIGIQCGPKRLETPSSKDILNHSNNIVIAGSGGSGKSVLLRHLFLDCIRKHMFCPILIELRDLNSDFTNLEQAISYSLETHGFNTNGEYIEKAKRAGHFSFFLDGYDEVDHKIRKTLMKDISKLSTKFKKCPIVITSRPDDALNSMEAFSIFKVLPLTLTSALLLIKKLTFDETIKVKFYNDLEKNLFAEHESFLSNPLLLSIMLLTYGENAEIPSKLSIFYNQAYEALFQRHDANKGGFSRVRLTNLDIQDFSRVFSLIALQTYEKRLFKMSRIECLNFIRKSRESTQLSFNDDDYLQDLLSAACLFVEEGLDVAFTHRSFQEYFVAIYIKDAIPEIQDKLINLYCKNIVSDNVIKLLYELNPDLIERVLVIPKLKAMFNEIGVKRDVGVSHTVKYLKRTYTRLNVEQGNISATIKDIKNCETPLISMI